MTAKIRFRSARPERSITTILVVVVGIVSILTVIVGRSAALSATFASVPTISAEPASASQTALLATLRSLGMLRHTLPGVRTVSEDVPLSGVTYEVMTTGSINASIDLSAIARTDLEIPAPDVAILALPNITLTPAADVRQESRMLGQSTWTRLREVESRYPALYQTGEGELAMLTSDHQVLCAASYWVQQYLQRAVAAARVTTFTTRAATSC
jgi:hypothetical protein